MGGGGGGGRRRGWEWDKSEGKATRQLDKQYPKSLAAIEMSGNQSLRSKKKINKKKRECF